MIEDFFSIFIFLFILCLPIILIRGLFRVNYRCRYLKKISDQLEKNSANHIGPSEKVQQSKIPRPKIPQFYKPQLYKVKNGFFKTKCHFCEKIIEVPKEYAGKEIRCSFCEETFLAKVSS